MSKKQIVAVSKEVWHYQKKIWLLTWEIVKERNVPVVARNFILHMQVGLIKEQKQEKAQSIIAAGVVLEKMNKQKVRKSND